MLSPERWDQLLSEILQSRISRRVLAKQLIVLVSSWTSTSTIHKTPRLIGIIDANCQARDLVERVAQRCLRELQESFPVLPEIIIDGHVDAQFTYIPQHVEYILYELILNSVQAVAKKHGGSKQHPGSMINNDIGSQLLSSSSASVSLLSSNAAAGASPSTPNDDERLEKPNVYFDCGTTVRNSRGPSNWSSSVAPGGGHSPTPAILVTISRSEQNIMFRVSDQGGGIPDDFMQNIWSYSFRAKRYPSSMYQNRTKDSIIVGYGLPMAKVYSSYWGGNLSLQTMLGHGTDAYLQLPSQGDKAV